jgi:hypothetical protein
VIAAAVVAISMLAPAGTRAGAAPALPALRFATPPDGATVAGPAVEIGLDIANFTFAPAGSFNESGKGHAHILVDEPPPAVRSFLPTNDPSIIHLGKAPFDTRAIDLPEGRHTLYAVLGDSDHLVVSQQPAKITIVVAPGFRAKGPLDQACADFATGSGEVRMVFPLGGGAVQGTIASTCAFATNSGGCTWTDSAFRRITGTFSPVQGAITAAAAGSTTRHLVSGSRKSCGQDRTSALGNQSFQAALAGGSVRGTLGRSPFILAADQSTRLAQPPTTIAAANASSGKHKRSKFAYLPFVGAALLLAGAGYYVVRSRASADTAAV